MTREERGSASVEFAVLVPLLVLLFGVVVGGARVWLARTTVEHAAVAAARAASLSRTPSAAVASGRALAREQLAADGLRCRGVAVDVDATGLAAPVGTPAEVRATVGCTLRLDDIPIPGWPGELRVEASASSVLDTFRGRQ